MFAAMRLSPQHTVSRGVVIRSSSWGCRSAMESLGVYLFAGAFCYPVADSRPSYAVQNAPLSAQANGDWPGSKSTGGTDHMLSILWTILIGFIAGVIAKFVTPGSTYEPKGFIFTTALGIVGALVATYLGQALGWYQAGHGAGFIASTHPAGVGIYRSPHIIARLAAEKSRQGSFAAGSTQMLMTGEIRATKNGNSTGLNEARHPEQLQGDDYPLEYDEKGYPELPDCRRR